MHDQNCCAQGWGDRLPLSGPELTHRFLTPKVHVKMEKWTKGKTLGLHLQGQTQPGQPPGSEGQMAPGPQGLCKASTDAS